MSYHHSNGTVGNWLDTICSPKLAVKMQQALKTTLVSILLHLFYWLSIVVITYTTHQNPLTMRIKRFNMTALLIDLLANGWMKSSCSSRPLSRSISCSIPEQHFKVRRNQQGFKIVSSHLAALSWCSLESPIFWNVTNKYRREWNMKQHSRARGPHTWKWILGKLLSVAR
jgi:hypothetical protein